MRLQIQPLNKRAEFVIPGSTEETLTYCVEHLMHAYREAILDHGAFYIALSGGSTPKAIFEKLTTSPIKEEIEWNKVHLFWGDERSVGPNDPESNYKMAMDAGLAKMGIPENQIHRMKAEGNIQAEAQAYETLLMEQLKSRPLDYLCLGMGEDGHTASLFPGTAALTETKRKVVANQVPQKNTWRMTFTFPYINSATKIVLYVLGDSKKDKVKEIFSLEQILYPVQQVGTEDNKALWILDTAATALLQQNTP